MPNEPRPAPTGWKGDAPGAYPRIRWANDTEMYAELGKPMPADDKVSDTKVLPPVKTDDAPKKVDDKKPGHDAAHGHHPEPMVKNQAGESVQPGAPKKTGGKLVVKNKHPLRIGSVFIWLVVLAVICLGVLALALMPLDSDGHATQGTANFAMILVVVELVVGAFYGLVIIFAAYTMKKERQVLGASIFWIVASVATWVLFFLLFFNVISPRTSVWQ